VGYNKALIQVQGTATSLVHPKPIPRFSAWLPKQTMVQIDILLQQFCRWLITQLLSRSSYVLRHFRAALQMGLTTKTSKPLATTKPKHFTSLWKCCKGVLKYWYLSRASEALQPTETLQQVGKIQPSLQNWTKNAWLSSSCCHWEQLSMRLGHHCPCYIALNQTKSTDTRMIDMDTKGLTTFW